MKSAVPTNQKSFWKVAVKDYAKVGTFFPSSRFAARSVAKQLPPNLEVVVEYGAGSGNVTRELLTHMPAHSQLIVVEQNPHFISALEGLGDSRLKVIHGDVEEVSAKLKHQFPDGVDAVVSGIPFAFLEGEKADRVVEATRSLLKTSGRFIVYQNTTKAWQILGNHFPRVKWFLEPRNMLPYVIYVAMLHR